MIIDLSFVGSYHTGIYLHYSLSYVIIYCRTDLPIEGLVQVISCVPGVLSVYVIHMGKVSSVFIIFQRRNKT